MALFPQPWLCAQQPAAGCAKNRLQTSSLCHHPIRGTAQGHAPAPRQLPLPSGLQAVDKPGQTGERGMVLLPGENKSFLSGVRGELGVGACGAVEQSDSHGTPCPLLPQSSAPAAGVGEVIGKGCKRR